MPRWIDEGRYGGVLADIIFTVFPQPKPFKASANLLEKALLNTAHRSCKAPEGTVTMAN